MQNSRKRTQGFTLIELVVATLIIGLLAAVLIPNALGARARANNSAVQTFLKNFAQEMEIKYADKGMYFPEGEEEDENDGYFRGAEIWYGVESFVDTFLSESEDLAAAAEPFGSTFDIVLPSNISMVIKTDDPDPYSGYCVVARWNSRDSDNYNTYILTPHQGVQLATAESDAVAECDSFGAPVGG